MVGGGIAGILAARLLAARGVRVVVVDREDALGGLFRSWQGGGGRWFDRGTHFALATGLPELDALLLPRGESDRWIRIEGKLAEGSWYGGMLNEDSGCVDLRRLPPDQLERARAEIVATATATQGEAASASLADEALRLYGPTIREAVIAPVMRKFTGASLERLQAGLHRVFGLQRVILFDAETSRRVKADPMLDQVVAFAHRSHYVSTQTKWYPCDGGIGRWVDDLTADFGSTGVETRLGRMVAGVESDGGRVTGVVLDDGTRLPADYLVWTVAAQLFLRACGEPTGKPPAMRALALVHLAFDQPLRTGLQFVTCFDPDMLAHRITLYPNSTRLLGQSIAPHLTVEVPVDPAAVDSGFAARIAAEVRAMGIVPGDAEATLAHVELLRGTYPLIDPLDADRFRTDAARAADLFPNVLLAGRDASGEHFQNGVLGGVWARLGDA